MVKIKKKQWWCICVLYTWILIVYMGATCIYMYIDIVYGCYAHVYWLCIWVLYEIWCECFYEGLYQVMIVFGPFTNFKMTTCEGQHFIETLWKTIFSSSSRETPNRILPNLAHLLILCVFTSVLCGVNKEAKENNNTKNQIHSWPFLYKPEEHRQQSKG